MDISKVNLWVDAIINEDGDRMSFGSLRTLNMIKNEVNKKPETAKASQLELPVVQKIAEVTEDYKNTYIKTLAQYLRQDPQANKFEKEYEFEEYLCELLDKDASVLEGLINALEVYLNK